MPFDISFSPTSLSQLCSQTCDQLEDLDDRLTCKEVLHATAGNDKLYNSMLVCRDSTWAMAAGWMLLVGVLFWRVSHANKTPLLACLLAKEWLVLVCLRH